MPVLDTGGVLFECCGLYIVGGVRWALNGLENQRVENKSCSASQFSTGAPGCFILLALNHSDVAAATLTPQPGGAVMKDSLHRVGGSMGSRILEDNFPPCRLIPASSVHLALRSSLPWLPLLQADRGVTASSRGCSAVSAAETTSLSLVLQPSITF